MPKTQEKVEGKIVKFQVPVNITELTKEAYQNFPEAAMCLHCTYFKYDKPFRFKFYDENEDKTHTVNLEMAEKGVEIMLQNWLDNKCFFDGVNTFNDLIIDTGAWDAIVFDYAMQCAIFGNAPYG
jgi:hypothetical protein